jgi:glutamyl-tRNA synthetase
LREAETWQRVIHQPLTPVIEDPAFTASAADALPAEPWTDATWTEWTNAVKAKTGAKGRGLFHPLRLALTGRDTGPEMKALLPLIGRERALARLRGATA